MSAKRAERPANIQCVSSGVLYGCKQGKLQPLRTLPELALLAINALTQQDIISIIHINKNTPAYISMKESSAPLQYKDSIVLSHQYMGNTHARGKTAGRTSSL